MANRRRLADDQVQLLAGCRSAEVRAYHRPAVVFFLFLALRYPVAVLLAPPALLVAPPPSPNPLPSAKGPPAACRPPFSTCQPPSVTRGPQRPSVTRGPQRPSVTSGPVHNVPEGSILCQTGTVWFLCFAGGETNHPDTPERIARGSSMMTRNGGTILLLEEGCLTLGAGK